MGGVKLGKSGNHKEYSWTEESNAEIQNPEFDWTSKLLIDY